MQYLPCNLCGADNWFVRFHSTLNGTSSLEVDAFRCTSSGYGKHAQIVECHECGHVYANPSWEPNELIEAYETVEDETYVNERIGRELTFRKNLEHLEEVTGRGEGRQLLDVGAYIGVFVEVAQAAGWQAMGVDPSAWAVEQAQKRGLNVIEGTLDAELLQTQQFDLITMWDVIEHVTDPSAEIKKCYNLLKPGGALALHTMDIDSWTARLMGKRWPWLMSMHIQFFSQRSLASMLQRCGFEIVRSKTEGRYLRLGYLATRVGGLNRRLGQLAMRIVEQFNLAEKAVPVNFGDLFTVVAIRPKFPAS